MTAVIRGFSSGANRTAARVIQPVRRFPMLNRQA